MDDFLVCHEYCGSNLYNDIDLLAYRLHLILSYSKVHRTSLISEQKAEALICEKIAIMLDEILSIHVDEKYNKCK